MAGYSGTPLQRKLGIKKNFNIGVVDAPANLVRLLGDLPENAHIVSRLKKDLDIAMLFVADEKSLRRWFRPLAEKIKSNGMIWVAWPKKSSMVKTELSFDVVQRIGLNAGLVDVKICAIDDIWSGLKFVYRLQDRGPGK